MNNHSVSLTYNVLFEWYLNVFFILFQLEAELMALEANKVLRLHDTKGMKLAELQRIVTEVLNSMFQCVIGWYGTPHRTINQFSIPRGGTQQVNC